MKKWKKLKYNFKMHLHLPSHLEAIQMEERK